MTLQWEKRDATIQRALPREGWLRAICVDVREKESDDEYAIDKAPKIKCGSHL